MPSWFQTVVESIAPEDRPHVLAELLQREVARGKLSEEVAEALRARTTMAVVSLAVVRRRPDESNGCDVLLFRHRSDHPVWPKQHYCPTTEFVGHEPPESALERIVRTQLGPVELISGLTHLGTSRLVTAQGPVMDDLYCCVLSGDYSGRGTWFRVDRLTEAVSHLPEQMRRVRSWVHTPEAQQHLRRGGEVRVG